MADYSPDHWTVLRMEHKDGVIYKVLGGWAGGYLHGDSWRLNSGIERCEQDGDYYKFYGSSGSCYTCHKEMYGLRTATIGIWATMKKQYPDQVSVMPEETDWLNMHWNGSEVDDAQTVPANRSSGIGQEHVDQETR